MRSMRLASLPSMPFRLAACSLANEMLLLARLGSTSRLLARLGPAQLSVGMRGSCAGQAPLGSCSLLRRRRLSLQRRHP